MGQLDNIFTKRKIIVLSIVFTLCLGSFVVCVSYYYLKNEQIRFWQKTTGTIVDVDWAAKKYRVVYNYTINGQQFTNDRVSYLHIDNAVKSRKFKKGLTIPVYVNPNDKNESALEYVYFTPELLVYLLIVLFVFMIPFFVVLISTVKLGEKERGQSLNSE